MPDTRRKKTRPPGGEIVDAGELQTPTEPIDPEIAEEFEEARRLGHDVTRFSEKLRQHTSESPKLTAGDVDAAWDRSDVGEEGPGGTVSTPDQDVVEELGEAVGQTWEDNQPLDNVVKLERRGGPRWEMDPASSEDYQERQGRPPRRKPRR